MLGRITSKSLHSVLMLLEGLNFYIPRARTRLLQLDYQATLNSGSVFPAAYSFTG